MKHLLSSSGISYYRREASWHIDYVHGKFSLLIYVWSLLVIYILLLSILAIQLHSQTVAAEMRETLDSRPCCFLILPSFLSAFDCNQEATMSCGMFFLLLIAM